VDVTTFVGWFSLFRNIRFLENIAGVVLGIDVDANNIHRPLQRMMHDGQDTRGCSVFCVRVGGLSRRTLPWLTSKNYTV